MAQMPSSLRAALVCEPWQIDKLWALELPETDIPVDELAWLLVLPLWQRSGQRFQVSPSDVLARPDYYPHHVHRIDQADLTTPIHVIRRDGRWTILDGFHRLAKASRLGRQTIRAHQLSETDLDAICRR